MILGLCANVGGRGRIVRTKFWRKKDAQLDKRLSTVIETTERARKTRQPLNRRVQIDTTYVEQHEEGLEDGSLLHPDEGVASQPASADARPSIEGSACDDAAELLALPQASAAAPQELADGSPDVAAEAEQADWNAVFPALNEAGEGLRAAHEMDNEVAALRDVIKRKEQAAREAQMAFEAEAAARETLARRAEEAERALSIAQAAAEARERAARATAEARIAEIAENRAVIAERDELARRLQVREAELTEVRAASEDAARRASGVAQDMTRVSEARAEAEAALSDLASRLQAVEAELRQAQARLAEEQDARKAAETAHDEFRRKLEQAQSAAQSLRDAVAEASASRDALALDVEREKGSRRLAEEARTEIEAKLAAAGAERSQLASRCVEIEGELESLRMRHATHAGELQDAVAAVQREAIARRTAELERDEVLARIKTAEAELASSRDSGAARDAEMRAGFDAERSALLSRLAEVEAQLAEARVLADSRDGALQIEAEARGREAAARRSATVERDEWEKRALRAEAELALLRQATEASAIGEISPVSVSQVAELPQPEVIEAPEGSSDPAGAAKREVEVDVQSPKPAMALGGAESATARLAARLGLKNPVEAEAVAADGAVVSGEQTQTEPEAVVDGTRQPAPSLRKRPKEPAEAAAGKSSDNRRMRRVSSQMPATLWREGMGQPAVCSLKDRSSSGARVEFPRHSMVDGFSAFNVGEHVTLTLNSAQERTWVGCEVVWVSGNACGVRFLGQFRSETAATRKPVRSAAGTDKSARGKAGSRLASVFSSKS